jgi:hypothetical protein
MAVFAWLRGCAVLVAAVMAWGSPRPADAAVVALACPGSQFAGAPALSGGILCTYLQSLEYHPTYDGGLWIYVDLVDIVAGKPPALAAIRAGTTGNPAFPAVQGQPAPPAMPPIHVVHMTVCLSDPTAHYSQCPNNYQPTSYILPPQTLLNLANGLAQIRAAGLKVVLNFTYNWPCSDTSIPNCNYPGTDAPLDMILQHMMQIAPFIQANADIIAGLHAGFIGQWGEWHSSTSGNDNTAAHNVFLDQFIALFGKHVNLEVRYPYTILDYAQYRFDSRDPQQARRLPLGIHDDEFGSNTGDGGTFLPATYAGATTYTNCQLIEAARIAAGANTLSAEMTAPYTDATLCQETYPRGDFLEFAQRSSLTSLHLGFPQQAWQDWYGSTPETKDEHRYRHIIRSIGPHLSLDSATIIELAGQPVLMATIRNGGTAAIARSRPLQLIVARDGVTQAMPAGADLAGVPSGGSMNIEVPLGSSLALPGSYTLYLAAPDPGLPNDPRYALQFENVGTWNPATGFNTLMTLQVQ